MRYSFFSSSLLVLFSSIIKSQIASSSCFLKVVPVGFSGEQSAIKEEINEMLQMLKTALEKTSKVEALA